MKAYLSLFLTISLIFSVSKKNKNFNKNKLSILTSFKIDKGFSYKESLNKWAELKKDNGHSYTYQTTFLSWAGFGSTTEIKVINGKVTARTYQEFSTVEQTEKRVITYSYSENNDLLGNHEKGALPLTIDELYTSCAGDYLVVDSKKNTIYFETKINGLMTLCGFVPNGCADDCFEGISIDSFEWMD